VDIGRLEQLNNILPIGATRSINPLETLLFHNRFVRESYALEQSNRDMGRRRSVFFGFDVQERNGIVCARQRLLLSIQAPSRRNAAIKKSKRKKGELVWVMV